MKLVAIALCSLLATGCATIVGSTTHTVGLTSSPLGAKVVVRDEAGREVFNGVTPASVIGGLIGWVLVDPATGAMWTYDQEHLNVVMTRPGATPATQATPVSP